jgi:protein SCO1
MDVRRSGTSASAAHGVAEVKRLRLALAGIGAVAVLVGCSGGSERAEPGGGAAEAQAAPVAAHLHDHQEAGEPSGHSLFHLEPEWWDQSGATRRLASLGGRVQVLAMAYTHCAYACPRIIGDMKRLESALGPEYAELVGFTLASIDSERDTPERLAEFAEDLRLDPGRWTLLGADEGGVLELAAALGVRYRRESDAEFSHTNLIVVLTPTGEVALRLALGAEHAEALALIRSLASAGT